MPLTQEEPKAVVGEIRSDGLVYRVLSDGASVALVGWYGTAPEGEVLLPSYVESGEDLYDVTCIGERGENGRSVCVFAGSKVTTLTLSSSVQEIIEGALSGCPSLARIEVSSKNESFASFDGMLFSKDLSSLLTVPEGKEGAAHIPDQTTSVPASAFSQAPGLQSVEVGEGSVTFASRNGVLYSKNLKTLIACPLGAGKAAVIPAEVERIGEQAFAGCSLTSITALGLVSEIAPNAFTDETKANALVALLAGEDYEARKAAWETAGFTRFAEPAKPGDTSEPTVPESDQQASGLAYTLLDDYTLSVSWQGTSDPASDLEIPTTAGVGGVSYQVSTIASGAFTNRGSLASVKLPSTITSIQDAAFAGCANLQTITLPKGLRTIGDRAFEATGLADVWLPASVISVGARAFAACSSLTRVVAQSAPQVASDALAECAGVNVYCPAGSEDSWNVGLPAANNHLAPYGITLPEEPLTLEVDQSASLLDSDSLKAPEPIEVSYAYAAKPVSIDADGIATGKAPGTSEVVVTLTLDGTELARATRTVEVRYAITPFIIFTSNEDWHVTYDTNGGVPDIAEEQKTAVIWAGDTTVDYYYFSYWPFAEPEVSKLGYKFDGWYMKNGLKLNYKEPQIKYSVVVKEGEVDRVDLTAHWLPIHYNIAFDANGSGASVPGTISNVAYDTTASIPSTVPLRTGYTFLGWNTQQAGGAATRIAPGSTQSNLSATDGETVTLYAEWQPVTHTVSFYPNGGTGTMDPQTFTYDQPAKALSTCAFSRDGYAFAGWNTQADNNGTSYSEGQQLANLTSDLNLYAQWTTIYHTVTFDVRGGVPKPADQTVPEGSKLTEPTAPTRAGYTFGGWYKEFTCENAWSFESDTVTAPTTLYAKWTIAGFDLAAPTGQMLHFDVLTHEGATGTVSVKKSSLEPGGPVGNLRIPASVTYEGITYDVVSVPTSGFVSSYGLISVIFDSGTLPLTLGQVSFAGCRALSVVNLPENLTKIGRGCFTNSSSISYIKIPDSVTQIDDEAFASVIELETVELGSGLTQLSRMIFYGCTSLKTVRTKGTISSIPPNLQFAGTDTANLYVYVPTLEQKTFWENAGTGIPNDNIIVESAFYTVSFRVNDEASTVLEHIVPAGSPVEVPAVPSNPGYSVDGWFTDHTLVNRWDFSTPVTKDMTLYASWAKDASQGDFVFRMRDDGESLSIAARDPKAMSGNLVIPAYAEMNGVTYPVKEIDALGFFASKITSVTLPKALERIGTQAFKDTSSLEEIVFAKNGSLTIIDSDAFESSGIKELRIPASVKKVGRTAFYNCDSLTYAAFEEGSSVVVLEETLFGRSDNLEVVELPDSAKEMLRFVFTECPKLRAVKMPASLEAIRPEAFRSCVSLKSLELPAKVRDIDDQAFIASGLRDVYVKGNINSLGAHSFYGVASPVNVYLPSVDSKAVWETYKSKYPSPVLNLIVNGEAGATLHTVTFDSNGGVPASGSAQVVSGQPVPRPADPVKPGAVFEAWYATSDLSGAPYDFAQPVTGDLSLYAKYADYAGELPMVDGKGKATWTFTPEDGTLSIDVQADGAVAELWADLAQTAQGYWGPLRAQVKRVVMDPSLKAASMKAWFERMPNLTDVSGIFVPEGCTDVSNLFYDSGSFSLLSDSFRLPESVEYAGSLFNRATSLVALPTGFRFPGALKDANSAFMHTKIAALPQGFSLPDTLTNVASLFNGCAELKSLPVGFRMPVNTAAEISVVSLFSGCSKLASLPEGFVVPDNVGTMEGMFYACDALTSFPDSFDFPVDKANASGATAFYCTKQTKTYFGGPSSSAVYSYGEWAKSKREIVSVVPDGCVRVAFMLPDDTGAYTKTLMNALTDELGMLPEPLAPALEGKAFVGWYTDVECTRLFDFAQSVTAQGNGAPNPVTTLYARYSDSEGALPTVTGSGSAWWSLSADGTLTISGDGEVTSLGWITNAPDEPWNKSYWGPLRKLVKKVVIDQRLQAKDMEMWFLHMTNLVNIDEAVIPDGCTSLKNTFGSCTSLTELPRNFALPASLETMNGLFNGCTSLASLPATFRIPEGVTDVAWAFGRCPLRELPDGLALPTTVTDVHSMFQGSGIASLPEGFVLHKGITNVSSMFKECASLVALPEGFTIPASVTHLSMMFYQCASLASLPEGFTIPTNAALDVTTKMDNLFFGCDKLTSLPSSFDFPLDVAKASVNPFRATNANTLTYFAGPESSSVRQYPWDGQNRTLVVPDDPNNPLPEETHLVTFMVSDPAHAGRWVPYATSLTSADGTVANPGDPARFGYPFQGWYRDAACTQPFDFRVALAQDTTVYGAFGAVILRYEVPLVTEVSVDATGEVAPVPLAFKSFTPESVSVKQVSSTLGSGAAALLPQVVDRDQVEVALTLGYSGRFKLDGGAMPLSLQLGVASGFAQPGKAEGTLALDLNGAQVAYHETAVQNVARLEWTVGLT